MFGFPDVCLWSSIGFVLIPFGLGLFALLREWLGSRHRQQYCPECGRPAPVIGGATRCSQCGYEYDQFGNPVAEDQPRPDWLRLDLDKFDKHPPMLDDPRYGKKDGYQEGSSS
jgi:hypothetical protein